MGLCDFDQIFELQPLHRESGEEFPEPISPQQYRRWHFPQAIPGGTRPKVGGAHDKIL